MDDILVIEAKVSIETLENDAASIIQHIKPDWSKSEIQFKTFTDGITNKLVGVYHKDKPDDILLMRIYGNNTHLLIDREAEKSNFRTLHRAGLAPRLYAEFDNGLVYDYVRGVTTNPDTIRLPHIYPLVARTMARLHKVHSNMKQPKLWNLGKLMLSLIPRQYSKEEKQTRFNSLFPNGLAQLQSDWQYLESCLGKTKSPVVFCHNDLLLGNIIYDEQDEKVTFIDYEYAGVNYQAFDIANHFDEYAGISSIDHSRYPGPDHQLAWLRTYLEEYTGCPPSAQHLATLHWQVQQFSPAAHLAWTIWALVQAEHSDIEFDFFQFGASAYEGYVMKRDKYLGPAPPGDTSKSPSSGVEKQGE
uniref:ethanolamine kinase n=1 Tax=Cacopsylla melanoneura TaxID=428564 RepID=A0A8D8S546_9HEMI